MPYIEERRRAELPSEFFARLADEPTSGDLNYLFTVIGKEYLDIHGVRYKFINDILGALEGAKLEFYRRLASDYEDFCIERNGDVY